MKDTIIHVVSMYQVGGLLENSVDEEHVLTLKSVIAMMEAMDKGILFKIVDIIAFFVKEDIFNCMEILEKISVKKRWQGCVLS